MRLVERMTNGRKDNLDLVFGDDQRRRENQRIATTANQDAFVEATHCDRARDRAWPAVCRRGRTSVSARHDHSSASAEIVRAPADAIWIPVPARSREIPTRSRADGRFRRFSYWFGATPCLAKKSSIPRGEFASNASSRPAADSAAFSFARGTMAAS